MAIAFPTNPANGDQYQYGGKTYEYNSTRNSWDVIITTTAGDIAAVDVNITPKTTDNVTLGTPEKRFSELYLSPNSIYLGDTVFSAADVLPFSLEVLPEVLAIQAAAPAAGSGHTWLWTWETSTLPYARIEITNQSQLNVPLYKQGTYVVDNFANTISGEMTQTHKLYLKWIDGAGTDNLVDWVTYTDPFTTSHPDINGGADTDVQRLSIAVPENITLPTLVAPTVSYDVTNDSAGAYTFSGNASGNNPNIGPIYRGGTYTFNVNATGHPFYLTTDNGTNFSAGTYFGEYTSGVTGSRTESGSITIVVPNDAPDTLYYQCGNHAAMRGVINVRDLEVETNNNGNYVLYFQHSQESHKTPVEIRPVPTLTSQMCLVYDAGQGKFVLQDMATYVENTPSFRNKIQEVAGTATLIAPDGVPVVASVSIYSDATYLPLAGNSVGDLAFDSTDQIMYVWDGDSWNSVSGTTDGITTNDLNAALGNYATSTELTTAVANITVPSSINDLTDVDTSSAAPVTGQALVYDGTKFAPGDVASGGGGSTQKTYSFVGPMQENVSRERLYVGEAGVLTKIITTLGTTGNTSTEIKIKKNGIVINTITIPANTDLVTTTTSQNLAVGDYFTVDITKSSSATNLYVTLIYGAE